MPKKNKKTESSSNLKKKRRSNSPTTDGDPQGNVSPEDGASAENGNHAVPPSETCLPISDGNHEKKGFLSLVSSLNLSEEVIYVAEHGFEKSSKEQIEKTLDEIIPILLDRMTAENVEVDSSVSTILSFLKALQRWTDYGNRHMVQCMFTLFSTTISVQNVDSVWRSHMVHLTTKFVQTTHFNEHSKYGLCLLGHLFSVALNISGKPVTTADIKRIRELKTFILQVDLLDPSMNDILESFMAALVSKDFLKSRDGILVLAHFLSKEASLVKTIQMKIRNNLSNFTKKLAANYGEVYFHAWFLTEAGSLIRKEIEERCIQDIMLRTMFLRRNGVEMGPVGNLTFGILQVLRANRRLTKFSQLITELYQPILWRNLKSHNPIVRCNAAQVFFDVFPLEKVGQGATANCTFKDMQVKEIKDLLLDECHIVRIIAIRGIAPVLIQSGTLLSIADMKDIMYILMVKLTSDATPLVPSAVFKTVENLVADSNNRKMVLPILKNMKMCLHDVNERVGKSFVKVLLRLKEINDPDALFWDVVPFKHILYRLEEEDRPAVGELLVKLVFSNIYTEGQTIHKTMSNLIKVIKISDVALMKLFKFSHKEVKVKDAYDILVTIVGVMNKKIKERMAEITNENRAKNEASTSNNTQRRKKKSSRTLKNITNRNDSEEEEGSSSESSVEEPATEDKPNFLDDHVVVGGLLNAASVLWVTYSDDLRKIGKYDTINLIATPAVPLLLRYYKGTRLYYTVVSFAALIPIQLLAPHTTVTGACIAELKEMDESCDLEKMKCLVVALSSWNRGHDVVELAVDWLNQVFRHENLNSTLLPRSGKRTTKVRFRPTQGKPFLAIQLLEMLFGHKACEPTLVLKNYDQLYETFIYLERIKELVERRLENGEEFNEPDLCDLFLERCLNVYLSMIIMLHRPDSPPGQMSDASEPLEPVSAASVSSEMICWASRVFMPHLKEETELQFSFASNCLHRVLKFSLLAVDISYTDKIHSLALALLASKLMDTGSPLHFMEINFELVKCLCEYSKVYNTKDEWEIFSNVVPSLLQQSLDIVASTDVTPEELAHMMENFKKFKLNLFYPLVAFKEFFDLQHRAFHHLCDMYLSTCLQLITRELAKMDDIEVQSKLDEHPFFVSLIMKYFLSKPPLTSLILPWLQAHVISHKQDPVEILSCISILSTILVSFKSKFQVSRLEELVSKCYELMMAQDIEEDLRTKVETIILDVCKSSGCALIKSS